MVKFKIGRILLPALALAATVSSSFAQVSIGGVTAQNAQVSREKVETKYGTFYVKGGFPVERYESGAVKSFYIENFGQLTSLSFPKGSSGASYVGTIHIETPVPGIDYLSKKNAQPIEFYEDGTLKAVRLADVRYESLGGDGYKHITFKKYKESLAVFPKSTIHFHENGNIKSMKVAHDQSFKFLRELKTSSNKKPVFKNQSEIVFYESGAIKEFIPENARLTNPFGFGMRPGYSVVVGEDDPKKVLSFYPAAGSALTLGDGIKVTCVPKEPVVFYGDGKTLKQISWSFEGTNFTLGKVNFYSSSEGGATSQTVFFSETGGVKSVRGIFADLLSTEKRRSQATRRWWTASPRPSAKLTMTKTAKSPWWISPCRSRFRRMRSRAERKYFPPGKFTTRTGRGSPRSGTPPCEVRWVLFTTRTTTAF
ncbi:MAG: hypothetical protein K2J68_03810 [Treponemataceae bacterium]|nr:hypothetical protein [Treponemataceae bacterium]